MLVPPKAGAGGGSITGAASEAASKGPGTSGAHAKREIELDFVRGLAILMVLDYHAPVHWMGSPFRLLGFPNFGWAGVDVFFVLSGFLVGGLLIKEWRVRGSIDGRRFLLRRSFKIWPQYYVFLGLMLLTGHRSFHQLWGNLLNVQNYTGGIPHTWSLAVEEHAYLLLALGFAWAARARIRVRTAAWTLAAACALVVVGRLWLTEHGYQVVSRTHTRIEGILYGVLLAMAFHYRPQMFARWRGRPWVWGTMLLAALTFLRFQTEAPWSASLGWDAANLLGVALLMLLYRPGRVRPHSMVYRAIAWIGVYSYGIYLWHVSVISVSQRLTAHLPAWLATPWRALVPILAGIALGALFTRLVELPALKLRDRILPRGVDSPVGTPAMVEAGMGGAGKAGTAGAELGRAAWDAVPSGQS